MGATRGMVTPDAPATLNRPGLSDAACMPSWVFRICAVWLSPAQIDFQGLCLRRDSKMWVHRGTAGGGLTGA